jgi:hypothetical protein
VQHYTEISYGIHSTHDTHNVINEQITYFGTNTLTYYTDRKFQLAVGYCYYYYDKFIIGHSHNLGESTLYLDDLSESGVCVPILRVKLNQMFSPVKVLKFDQIHCVVSSHNIRIIKNYKTVYKINKSQVGNQKFIDARFLPSGILAVLTYGGMYCEFIFLIFEQNFTLIVQAY